MAEQAHVTSVEALESFRAALINYVSKARPTLEEISAEVLRTRIWLENDQRVYWEGQVRRRSKVLEQAQQALSSARFSSFRDGNAVEQMAVHRAKHALEEAGAKLKLLKQWNRDFSSRVEPLARQLEKLHTVLAVDMVGAAAYLARAIETLAAYAEVAPPGATAASISPAAAETRDEAAAFTESVRKILPEGDEA
jgi:hypothetical protein